MNKSSLKIVLRYSVIIFILLIFILSYVYYDFALNLFTNYLSEYSYYAIAVLAMILEGVPQLLSTDILIVMGQLVGLNMINILISVVIGSTIGSLISFYLGYKYGKKIALLFINQAQFNKTTNYIQKNGKYALPLISFAPLPYFPIIFGVMKINIWEFLIYGLTARAVKHTLLVGLIYYLSTNQTLVNYTQWFGL